MKTAEHDNENGKRTKAKLFQLFLTNFKKDLLQYEDHETLDRFEVNVPKNLLFRNKLKRFQHW